VRAGAPGQPPQFPAGQRPLTGCTGPIRFAAVRDRCYNVGMAQVTLRGNPLQTSGELPTVGSPAPSFTLVGGDLSEITSESFTGRAAGRADAVVLCVSEDLPFAASRFCGAEGIENVRTGSGFRSDFAEAYGVRLQDGPLAGLMARSVVVIDEHGTVTHTQLVG